VRYFLERAGLTAGLYRETLDWMTWDLFWWKTGTERTPPEAYAGGQVSSLGPEETKQ
jgi:hypothetical protein